MTFCWVHATPGLRTLIDSQCPWPPLWRARRLPKHRSALARRYPSRLSCWFDVPWRVKMHSFPPKVLSVCWLIYSIYLYLICHVSVLWVYLCMRTIRSLMLTCKVQSVQLAKKKTVSIMLYIGNKHPGWHMPRMPWSSLTSVSELTFLCRVISREKPKDGPEQGRTRLAKWHVSIIALAN